MAIKFSIIVPAYNVLPYIAEALDSVVGAVLAVASGKAEVICVDDGSTDGTGRALDNYAQSISDKFPTFDPGCLRIIHQPNGGVSSARNHGIMEARGEWCLFVDSDDWLLPDALVQLSRFIDENPAVQAIQYGYKIVNEHEAWVARPEGVVANGRVYSISDPNQAKAAFHAFVGRLMAWNGCVRSEIAKSVLFKKYPNGEDTLFGVQVFCAANTVATLHAVLYLYRQREGSAVHSPTMKHLDSALSVAEEECATLRSWRCKELVQDGFFHEHLRSTIVGDMYVIAAQLGSEGWRRIALTLGRIRKEYPEYLSRFDKLRIDLSVRFGGAVFYVTFRLPFVARVKLQRLPMVNAIKLFVRRAR